MKKFADKSFKSALMVATALAVTPSVNAQVGNRDAGANADSNVIIVTARKKEENLQTVPVTVNVFGEQMIDDANITGLEELSDFTPGFQLQSAFGRDADRPVIRGASNILFSEGKVGYFVDGIPFIGPSTALDLENFGRVEVLKGPQSAVFGRGTLSGAVNYVTRAPAKELAAEFEVTAATYDKYEIFGRVEAPIADGFSAFASAKYSKFGGFYTNALTGDDLGQETLSLAGGLNYQSDDFEASVAYFHTEDNDDHFTIGVQDSSYNNIYKEGSRGYYKGIVSLREPIKLNTNELIEPGVNRKSDRVLAKATAELGDSGFTATALFGYTSIKQRNGTDQSYEGNSPFFAPCGANCSFIVSPFNVDTEIKREAVSAELRFASPQDKPIRAEVGGILFDDSTHFTDYGRKFTSVNPDPIGESTGATNMALFGLVEFDVTDRLTIGGELRAARDEVRTRKGDSYVVGDLFPTAANPNQVIPGLGTNRTAVFKSILPRVTLDYKVTDDVLVYAVYSQGNSPGGFNKTGAPKSTFGEELLTNYELGFKAQPFYGLTFNVAAFYNEYSDQVLTSNFVTAIGGTDSYSENVGDSEIKGIEMEASWKATDFLTFAATYAYIDAKFVNGFSGEQSALIGGTAGLGTVPNAAAPGGFSNTTKGCSNPLTTLNAGQKLGDGTITTAPTPCMPFADISGNTVPLVSKHQATFTTALDMPIGNAGWNLFARADVIYRSSFYANIHNLAETGDATKVNFSLGMRDDSLSIRFWVKNAFQDETPRGILRYVDFQAPRLNGESPRAFAITPPDKRQFGVTLSGKF